MIRFIYSAPLLPDDKNSSAAASDTVNFDLKSSSKRGKELDQVIGEMESTKIKEDDSNDDNDLLALMDSAK